LSQPKRRLAAIMFTDMVGYTALAQRNESLSLALVDEQRNLVRPILGRHYGREVKTMGDAFLVEFSSALAAANCAYDIQKAVRKFNADLPEERRIRLRIGVHLGDVVESQGGDISGDAVNVASRVEPLAESGGVCLTRQVYDQITNKFELRLESMGSKPLRNVDAPVEVYRMVMPWSEEKAQEAPEREKRRIAVLPLANLSSNKADEYLADGMTEELITSLSGVRELTVVARTSMMRYKGSPKGISEIGRELNVGTLVEGSVRKAGNRVRVTVQLIDTGSEGHIWAQNYDRQLDDLFAIQSEIAESVAAELRIKLVDSERKRLEKRPTANAEAYTLYLKARLFWDERSKESIQKAIAYFNRAIKLDPKFALGYSGLADCYQVMGHNQLAEFGPSYEKARECTKKALELDRDLAEPHAALAGVKTNYERDWKGAEVEYRRAIELKPGYATAHQWYAIFLGMRGRFEEAEREIRKALELDPLSLIINVNLGDTYYYRKEYDKAIEQYRSVIEMDRGFAVAYSSAIPSYLRKGMFEEAMNAAETYARLTGQLAWGKLYKGYVYAAMGKVDDARRTLKKAEVGYRKEHLSPYLMATCCFLMGDKEDGFRWLQRAYDEHDSAIGGVFIDPDLERARSDPRYLAMLEKVGLLKTARPRRRPPAE
jgi:adenylate cyclase